MLKAKRIGAHDLPAPARQTISAAGYDLQATADHMIKPLERKLIPTGFAWAIPAGHVGIVKSRSSMAMRGVHAQAGVIDADYRGEVMVLLENTGADAAVIKAGQRVAQMVVIQHGTDAVELVEDLPGTDRGADGFGSTGV